MIFNQVTTKILEINKKAAEVSAIRFDKGSPSPRFTSFLDKTKTDKLLSTLSDLINTYPREEGFPPLIDLIQEIELRVSQRKVKKDEICLTNGVLSGLFYVLASLLHQKDTVILNNVSFEGFDSVINALGLTSVRVDIENKTKLEKAIKKSETKVLILNSPENPSGKIYQKESLLLLDSIAKKYNVLIISDEVNNQNIHQPYTFVPPNQYISNKHLITINSFSKNYFLPGIRLGWIIADKSIIKKVRNIFSVSQVGIGYPSQVLGYAMVKSLDSEVKAYRKKLLLKKQLMEKVLKKEDFTFLYPVMAGSVFFTHTNVNSQILADHLLNTYKIAVIPGICFGEKWKNWLRLGFGAVSDEEIKTRIPMIKKAQLELA